MYNSYKITGTRGLFQYLSISDISALRGVARGVAVEGSSSRGVVEAECCGTKGVAGAGRGVEGADPREGVGVCSSEDA